MKKWKKYLKTLTLLSVGVVAVFAVTLADINSIPHNQGILTESVTGDFADSEVDTVKYIRDGSGRLAGLAFACEWNDSVSVSLVTVRRIIDGTVQPLIAGDTLTAYTSFSDLTAASEPNAKTATVTLAPLADEYWFIVTYAGSNNGVTAPTVKYMAKKQLN